MRKSVRPRKSIFAYLFILSLLSTVIVYVLRGLAILSFIPGGIIFILVILSVFTGIFYAIDRMRRW